MRITTSSTCTLTGAQWDYRSWLAVQRAVRRILQSGSVQRMKVTAGAVRRTEERVVRI